MQNLDPSEELWEEIIRQSLEDEKGPEFGPAALRHLAEGRTIYYSDDNYPGETVKHYPDGHREIVAYDEEYRQVFISTLPRHRLAVTIEHGATRFVTKNLPDWLKKACPELTAP